MGQVLQRQPTTKHNNKIPLLPQTLHPPTPHTPPHHTHAHRQLRTHLSTGTVADRRTGNWPVEQAHAALAGGLVELEWYR